MSTAATILSSCSEIGSTGGAGGGDGDGITGRGGRASVWIRV
jgi:hypothetical protein